MIVIAELEMTLKEKSTKIREDRLSQRYKNESCIKKKYTY